MLREKLVNLLFTAISLSFVSVAVAQEPAKVQKNDPEVVKILLGDFVLRAGSVNGNSLTADRIANVSAKITEQTITTYDGQRKQKFGASYHIHNDKRPWQVTLKSVKTIKVEKGKTREKVEQSEGLLDLSEDGKRLRLAYNVNGGERPKDFKGAQHENVFEFERLAKPE